MLAPGNGSDRACLGGGHWGRRRADWRRVPWVNGKIAFVSDRNGQPDIYTMNVDGTEQTRLTLSPASDYEPVWSPDGTRILFRTLRDGNDEVYVMNADGSAQTNVTQNSAMDLHPNWSPDGTKMVFVSTRNDPYYASCDYWCYEIYTMNLDGTGVTRLTYNSDIDYYPAWSPDGSKIVFASTRAGGEWDWDIYVMNADGSGQTRLTYSGGLGDQPGLAVAAFLATPHIYAYANTAAPHFHPCATSAGSWRRGQASASRCRCSAWRTARTLWLVG